MRPWEKIELVVATSWQPNEKEFLSELGIEPGGIGAQFFQGAYSCLFSDSIDARNEFGQYYSVEYETFERYLEAKFGIVMNDDELGKQNIYLCKWLSSTLDKNYEDNQFDNVMACITNLEQKNEGQI